MLTIIQGADVAASRNFLSRLKETARDPVSLTGDAIDLTDLSQIFSGGGLFEDSKFVSIEKLLTNKKLSETKSIIELIVRNSDTHTIVIWESKELTKASLNKFPKATVKQFKLPQTLFQLMDSLKPGNAKQLVMMYHITQENVEEELILYMLARQIRLLLAIKTGSDVSELRQASWQVQKLRTQADLFTTDHLVAIHSGIYEIESDMKTGQGAFDTSVLIDFLLLKI